MAREPKVPTAAAKPPAVSADRPAFLLALIAAVRRPAAWGTTALGVAAMGLFAAGPVYRFVDARLENSVEFGSARFNLPQPFWIDHADRIDEVTAQIATTGGFLALAAFLFGVFTAGGWLRLLLDPGRGYGRLFFAGGARYFWRFLRLALIVLVLLHAVGVLFQGAIWREIVLEGWYGLTGGDMELARSELTVRQLGWASDGLYLLGTAAVLSWAILTRARMVLENRHSAFFSGLVTFGFLVRHPIATLRPMLVLVAVEFAFLIGIAVVYRGLESTLADGAGWLSFGPMLLLAASALVLREITHGARYGAALLVSRRLVRTISTDPWGDRIGGPGGPQYPLHDSDEFSVAM